MRLTWYGHSAFLVEASDGTRIILDPYRSGIFSGALGYAPIGERADLVVASHGHDDHGAVDTIPGNPRAVIGPGELSAGTVRITGVEVAHDESGGAERGGNTIMVLDDNGLRLVHLGDLGHVLDPETVAAIGRVDVLLVPVGGTYTIGAPAADEVVRSLSPRLVVPMHFSNDRCTMPISGVDEFLLLQEQVVRTGSSTMEITSESLPDELTIAVMDHAR